MTLDALLEQERTEAVLARAGLSHQATRRIAATFRRLAESFREIGTPPDALPVLVFVPGRIEVLGKHTDYAGGRSLTCAIERGFALAALPGEDDILIVTDLSFGETAAFPLDPDLEPRVGHWSNYPMTVARRVARDFGGELRGGHVFFASDLPVAAGVSSSSAFVVGIFQVLAGLNNLADHPFYREYLSTPEALAAYLGAVENGRPFGPAAADMGVGTLGGNEDHTAMLCARAGHLGLFSYHPVRQHASVAMPEDHLFVIAASGVMAPKTGSALAPYNRAAWLAAHITDVWNEATGQAHPHLGAIVADPDFAPRHMHRVLNAYAHEHCTVGEALYRYMHFLSENDRILPKAVRALEAGDLGAFGAAVAESQSTAERLLGNQVEETIYLASEARELGAVAASAFGAGYGGAVWALVPARQGGEFLKMWRHHYVRAFPGHAEGCLFFIENAGPAQLAL